MKLKLSSMLLIGILAIVVAIMFMSSFILKKQYDSIDLKDRYWHYKTLTTQSFKHIKIEQNFHVSDSIQTTPSVFGLIDFEVGDKYIVKANPTNSAFVFNKHEDDTMSTQVKNDTLFIKVPILSSFYNNGKLHTYNLAITAPQLESITFKHVSSDVTGLNQKHLNMVLTGRSIVTFINQFSDMTSIQATLKDKAVLELSPSMKISSLDVDLKNQSKLRMPVRPSESFKFNAGDGTFIEASSKFFKN